jgi:hypothetical protein
MERELILTYFRKPYSDEEGELFSASDILEQIGGRLACKMSLRKITKIMRSLGFEELRTRKKKGWKCVLLNYEEVRRQRRLDAMAPPDFSELPDASVLEDYDKADVSRSSVGDAGVTGKNGADGTLNDFDKRDVFDQLE